MSNLTPASGTEDHVVPNKPNIKKSITTGAHTNKNALECRVCEDIFLTQGDKVPRLLHCGHTVCLACLLRLPIKDDTITCPFDRQPTPVGYSGVWGLKKNFALLELIEKIQTNDEKATESIPLFSAEVLEKERKLHIKCDEDESHIAVLYCTVCASHLCEQCASDSHATRTLQKHRRIPLSEKPREKPFCSSHPTNIAEFICLEEHCQTSAQYPPLMCFICKDYGRHKTHKHALVEIEAENLRSYVKNASSNVQHLIEEITESVNTVDLVVSKIEGNTGPSGTEPGTGDQARAKVHAYFNHLRESLLVQEAAATSAVDMFVRERLGCLVQLHDDMGFWLQEVAKLYLKCEQMILQDDARVLTSGREIKEAIETIEKYDTLFNELTPEQIHPDPCIPITFTKDNRVHIGPKMEMRVVTLGLDSAGKTSVLFKLKQNEFMAPGGTIGFNVETLEYKNLKFTIWDVGGQPKLRPLWKHYYLNTQAVVFVIDSADKERLPEALAELTKLIAEKELKDAALLLLANKQDIPGCETVESITEAFDLYKLCCGRSWHIQACNAQSGEGLHEGLDWLSRQLIAAGVNDMS
ncbi:E3 ubiquitin-protein ligase TRIM23-like [Diaphorina citri]|uniref:RING-type E3 ubiquitin transferase n=1 Tax=Diaphorina citri TaxID=121845 RepID=A0A1S3CUV6_DIACI|nr:E3 ubiquitin-protein ligase TRIM23-like [Diaphorina citri]XP_008468290.1 E3 ubiquitin-protein ligase TRIM23-like [Diaphorina citri]XP_026676785.1 E3 ubiquitin-protein ligase TRIM23-like [Diaphorina citri]